MITLTTPVNVSTVLGSSATVGYNKLVAKNISVDVVAKKIISQISVAVSTDANQTEITGSMSIFLASGILEISIANFDFFRRIPLNAGQISAAQSVIDGLQADVESALVTLGVVAGTQSAGT